MRTGRKKLWVVAATLAMLVAAGVPATAAPPGDDDDHRGHPCVDIVHGAVDVQRDEDPIGDALGASRPTTVRVEVELAAPKCADATYELHVVKDDVDGGVGGEYDPNSPEGSHVALGSELDGDGSQDNPLILQVTVEDDDDWVCVWGQATRKGSVDRAPDSSCGEESANSSGGTYFK